MLLLSKLNYRGDWYLLRAKFTNDWNFLVREVRAVRRGNGMEERSLEIGEVLRGEEGDDGDRKQVYVVKITALSSFTLKHGITMKGRQGALQEQQMQTKHRRTSQGAEGGRGCSPPDSGKAIIFGQKLNFYGRIQQTTM